VRKRSPPIDRTPPIDESPLSEDDRDTLARAMADVVPLRRDGRERVAPAPVSRGDAPHTTVPVSAPDDELESAETSYAAPGVDRRVLRRLRRQEFGVDARLDVHGLTAAEALTRVEQFVEGSRHRRHVCVCIVHGRGLHSENGVAVLKTRVRERLRRMRHVVAFVDAPAGDGGAGAVYVLLRK